jgi:sec-independent protein translocase protein TatA
MGGISVWQLLIILVIVLVLFGAKRLRTLGTDLGSAVKGFRSAVKDGEEETTASKDKIEQKDSNRVIDVDVEESEKAKSKESDRA